MPDADEFDEFDDNTTVESDQFKAMRKRANQASKFERENGELRQQIAQLQRQTAFTSAGLALSEKQQAALLAAHGDADLTADALRATAVELGFAQPPEASAEEQQRETALQAQGRIAQSQAGALPPTPVPNRDEQISAAETSEDWATAMALKAQKVAQLAGMG